MTARDLKRVGFLLILPALLFLHPFLIGKSLFMGDVTYSFQPWLTYAAQEIQSGRLPLWNPYTACGEPFLANPQIMLFHPIAALYWLFPFTKAYGLFLLFNHALLFFFTYLLARRWLAQSAHRPGRLHAPAALAALAFAWSGFILSHWEFPSAVATLPFLPLLFLLGLGRAWGPLALGGALAFSAGYIQFVQYSFLLALAGAMQAFFFRDTPVRWPVRLRPLLWVGPALAGAILLALPVILPAWEATRHSLRTQVSLTEARHYLLTPLFLIKLWIPWITNPVALTFQNVPFGAEFWPIQRNWLTTFFLGTGPCLLAVAGLLKTGLRRSAVLFAVTGVAAVLAFGVEPLFGWARTLVPGVRYLTHFSNASVLALLCLVLWAAEGARGRRGRNILLACASLAFLATSLSLALSTTARETVLRGLLGTASLTPPQDRWVMEAGGASAAVTLAIIGVWLFFRRRRWAVLGVLTLAELWILGRALQPMGPARLFHEPLTLAREMAGSRHRFSISPATMKREKILSGTNLVQGYRSVRNAFYPNIPLPYRVHQTWGYEVFGLKTFSEFRRRIPELPGESRALDFLGASHLMSVVPLPPPSRLRAQAANAILYTRPQAMERVTVVPKALVFRYQDRLDHLFGPWDPETEVAVEEEETPVELDPPGRPTLIRWRDDPGRVIAEGEGAGWLVHSGVDYPGWEAAVNGKRAPLVRANHSFQAVTTPNEPWTVRLTYRPKLFWGGAWAAVLLTLGVMAGGFGWSLRALRHLSIRSARPAGG